MDTLVSATQNGNCLSWFDNPDKLLKSEELMRQYPIPKKTKNRSLEDTSYFNQLSVLMHRGYIKAKRDTTMTHLRIGVNIIVALMLGAVYANSGKEGSRVIDNYNLLFAILIHHSMTTMMLTVLTCRSYKNMRRRNTILNFILLFPLFTVPIEMSILLKEHFNRWYSLKAYYTSITLLDLPISVI